MWINDEEKKTTTSTALAVSWFHLDGASHLEERKERVSARLEVATWAGVATTEGHKPGMSSSHMNSYSAILIKVPWLRRQPKHHHTAESTWYSSVSGAGYLVKTKQSKLPFTHTHTQSYLGFFMAAAWRSWRAAYVCLSERDQGSPNKSESSHRRRDQCRPIDPGPWAVESVWLGRILWLEGSL